VFAKPLEPGFSLVAGFRVGEVFEEGGGVEGDGFAGVEGRGGRGWEDESGV